MKVIVCVKGVVQYDNSKKHDVQINPFDLLCLQNLLRIKNKENLNITCLCMGTLKAENMLRYCLALGADQAILVSDMCFAGSDTYATTYILAAAIKKIEFDFIVCGKQSIDGETGQVPYGIAKRLGIPIISSIKKVCSTSNNKLLIERINHTCEEDIICPTPVLLIFDDLSTTYPTTSLLRLKQVKKKKIDIFTHEILNLDPQCCGQRGSLTKVIATNHKHNCKETKFIEGTGNEITSFLFSRIMHHYEDIYNS